MTLEQIKIRQEEVNKLLEAHLQELTTIVERITGEIGIKQNEETTEKPTPKGLIEEISQKLYDLDNNIEHLIRLKQRLYISTFSPASIEKL